uniref:Uncharacterized protein n=1 Tax=Arundo donax TaxID=35708 RepID=A0A0A9B0V8_ARUDO
MFLVRSPISVIPSPSSIKTQNHLIHSYSIFFGAHWISSCFEFIFPACILYDVI